MKYCGKLVAFILLFLVFMISIVWIVDPSRCHQVLGDRGRKLGHYSYAVEHYSRAIHLSGTKPGAFNSRGVTRYYMGQFKSAIEDYNQAIKLDPQYALAIKNRSLALLAIGKAKEAKQGYELACSLGRCEDFTRRCPVLKLRCEMGECTSIQAAIEVGLCPEQRDLKLN